MMTKAESEEYAFRRITDYLKEEKNIQIKNARHLKEEKEEQPPDYYFEIGACKIGCEVRRFSVQGDQFNKHGDIETALEQGRREFRDSGGPALWARFHFGPATPEGKHQAKSIGKELARIVHIMCDNNMVEIEGVDHDVLFDEHGLSGYVSTISIYPVDEKCDDWRDVRAEFGVSASVEAVRKIIEAKEKKLSDRRKHYDSVWLLIHNDLDAGFYKITDKVKQFSYKCSFERIFWIEDLKVYELRGGSGNVR